MIHPHTELAWINRTVGNGVLATQRMPMATVVWVQCPLDVVLRPGPLQCLMQADSSSS